MRNGYGPTLSMHPIDTQQASLPLMSDNAALERNAPSPPPPPKFFRSRTGERIAYRHIPGKQPGIFYVHGLAGSMNGSKTRAIEDYARARGQAYTAIDLSGHGASSGKFHKQRFSDWRRQVNEALDKLAPGPQIFVGSSLGGWLMATAAQDRPEKVAGMVGLAASPNGVIDSMERKLTNRLRRQLSTRGYIDIEVTPTFGYRLERGFYEDGRRHNIYEQPNRFTGPAALINGTDDDMVLPETAHRYAAYLGPQAEAIMLKGEDHRLNSEAALARITQAIGEISTKVGFVPQPPVANDPGTGPTRKPVVDATPRPRR